MWYDPIQAVLIDTDIGDDVDDAFALALALRLPGLRVCGVTTVAGPVDRRAQLARLLLGAAGQNHVPVAAGSSVMRNGRPGAGKFSHQPVLDLADRPAASPTQSAADLILALAEAAGPLTIIALGPLTNIAAALDRDPTLARRTRLVAMAGKLGLPYPDWNLRCDPAAARHVLASGIPATLVGMHVTMRAKMRAEQLRKLFSSHDPLQQVLSRCVLAWRTWKRRIPILHDALTVAVAASPALAQLQPRQVRVGWRGFSLACPDNAASTLVCRDIDIDRYNVMIDRFLLGMPGAAQPDAWEQLLQRLA